MNDELPRAARDVPAGSSWAFVDHRTVAEVWKLEDVQFADVNEPSTDPIVRRGTSARRRGGTRPIVTNRPWFKPPRE
jgi:hypothetical protein